MVAMETSSHVDSDMSYQIVARQILEKVAKFGSVCFNIEKVINVQSCHGQIPPPPPGLDRVKQLFVQNSQFLLICVCVFFYEGNGSKIETIEIDGEMILLFIW